MVWKAKFFLVLQFFVLTVTAEQIQSFSNTEFYFQLAYLKIDYVNYTSYPEKSITYIHLDNSNADSTILDINVLMTEKKDAEKVKVQNFNYFSYILIVQIIIPFQVFLTIHEGSESTQIGTLFRCNKEVFKTSIDVCKMSQLRGNFLAKMLMENLFKSSNFDIQCPFKRTNSNMTIANLTLTGNHIPHAISSFKYCIDFNVKTCSKGEKKFASAIQGRVWIRFQRE